MFIFWDDPRMLFIKELEENLASEGGYAITLDSQSYEDRGYDALITLNTLPVAAIEFVSNSLSLPSKKRIWGKKIKASPFLMAILLSDDEIHVREEDKLRFRKIASVKQLADIIKIASANLVIDADRDILKEIIIKKISKYDSVPTIREAINILKASLVKMTASAGEIRIDDKDEDEFFISLLGKYTNNHLCRYTSVDSLFKTIDNANHSMCCPVSMNDPNEGHYADSKIALMNLPRTRQDVISDNSCYILSCSDISLEDELTMWRLYADDAKGVCIQYEVGNLTDETGDFYLAKVSYGEKDGKHQALDFLNDLMSHPIQQGWYFRFSRWYIWKYFFKSYVYRNENEVRLLYMPKKKNPKSKIWYKDSNNGLFNHLLTFPIQKNNNGFPLKMTKIILGPGVKLVRQNVEQISYMIEDKQIDTTRDFKVLRSVINNYR